MRCTLPSPPIYQQLKIMTIFYLRHNSCVKIDDRKESKHYIVSDFYSFLAIVMLLTCEKTAFMHFLIPIFLDNILHYLNLKNTNTHINTFMHACKPHTQTHAFTCK